MKRIMFVCHGNICRSPMAEFITKYIVSRLDLDEEYVIASSATSTEELGSPIYPPAQRELYRRGIPFDRREATQLRPSDYAGYDVFALMDDRNMRNVSRIFPSDPDGKVRKLLSFTGESRDVADPWYSGDFKGAYDDILDGCIALLTALDPRLTRDSILRALNDTRNK